MSTEQRSDTDQTEVNADQTAELLTVAEAAARLGLSTDAVRMRIRRGTLSSTEVDGRRLVLLPRPNDDQTAPNGDQTPTDQPHEQGPNRSDNAELLEQLRSEVSYLRQTLDAEIEARRRADHLVAGMIEERRALVAEIAELQASADVAPEHEAEHRPNGDQTEAKPADAPVDAQEGPGRADPPQMTARTLQGAFDQPVQTDVALVTGWRRWLRRIMGQEG